MPTIIDVKNFSECCFFLFLYRKSCSSSVQNSLKIQTLFNTFVIEINHYDISACNFSTIVTFIRIYILLLSLHFYDFYISICLLTQVFKVCWLNNAIKYSKYRKEEKDESDMNMHPFLFIMKARTVTQISLMQN